MSPKEIVSEYWALMGTNDFAAAADLFGENFTLEWPQSDEVVVGKDVFIQINEEYPSQGDWSFLVNRIVEEISLEEGPATVVTDVSITDGSTNARALTFSYVENNRIVRQVEYWPEDYSAPENRIHLTQKHHH